ncbi:MAG: hypothetical protein ACKO81_17750 [Planctomycetota bacterium]
MDPKNKPIPPRAGPPPQRIDALTNALVGRRLRGLHALQRL